MAKSPKKKKNFLDEITYWAEEYKLYFTLIFAKINYMFNNRI